MGFLAQISVWINVLTNTAGKFLLAPVGILPGWLSNAIVSAITGVMLMIIFKYTSNQRSIGQVRDSIKANMLAMKLFKDSIVVTLQAQVQLFKGALLLLFHAIRPMLVMIVPVSLLLAQLGLWYQYRPLQSEEQALVIMQLNGDTNDPWPDVDLKPMAAAKITIDHVQVFSKRQIYWKIRAIEKGYHRMIFQVAQRQIEKELVIGDGFMRVSNRRPGWHWADIIRYPSEQPFGPDSLVRSISIEYPDRLSRTSGTDWWLIYFFGASMVFALVFKPFLKVRI